MSSIFKLKTSSLLALGSCAGIIGIVAGCGGGGGGGGSSTPNVPGPYDGTYTASFVPTTTIPSDGKAPTGTLTVANGRAAGQFTFNVQPAAIKNYQPSIDAELTKRGYASDIRNNQIPTSITFTLVKNVDSSGKAVFTTTQRVRVCGIGTLVVDSTFLATGGGAGTYKLTFPNQFSFNIRGGYYGITAGNGLGCNNLPLREGTAAFTRPIPTATPTLPPTATPTVTTTPAA